MKFSFIDFYNSVMATIYDLPWLMQKLVGIILIGLGLAGLILPILPGWLFIIPGLGLIHPPLKERMETFSQEKKLPKRLKISIKAIKNAKFSRLLHVWI